MPLLPRVFSDIYSFASAHFEIGDYFQGNSSLGFLTALGALGFRQQKGLIGWIDEQTILVVGAGRDGRWERFKIGEDEVGKRAVRRDGWKRYLGG